MTSDDEPRSNFVAGGPPAALRAAAADMRAWLLDKAYPLWWRAGADPAGGFHDRLDSSQRPADHGKRLRVQARQVFCYALAPEFGWRGPWRQAMRHGLAFLENAARRPDGLYALAEGPGGSEASAPELYDQAFVLLALAHAHRRGEEGAEERALELLDRLPSAEGGGFRELAGDELLSNPNMHLCEAFLAWREAAPGPPWRDLATAAARLAVDRLADATSGAISEIYGAEWRLPGAAADRQVWPGHQFEWAWLILRHAKVAGGEGLVATALRLIEIGESYGVDIGRNVAIQALAGDLRATDLTARLWPQTERLKAALLAAEMTGEAGYWQLAERAVAGLRIYLVGTGTWRDRLTAGGVFIDEPAPASSFYHIVGAILALNRAVSPPAAR